MLKVRLLHLSLLIAFLSIQFLSGCHGKDTKAAEPSPSLTGTSATITGTVLKGPVSGATVTAFAIMNGQKGAELASATTDTTGRFTMSLTGHSGPILLQAMGGTYTDEATDSVMSLQQNDIMSAAVPSVELCSGLFITPLTSMARARAEIMNGGMTFENITAANGEVNNFFLISDILHSRPIDPLTQGSGKASGVSREMMHYGMALAAISQYAQVVGMSASSGMITAMSRDASDGIMDGMQGGVPISMSGMGGMTGGMLDRQAGRAGLGSAMATFLNSPMNRSELTETDLRELIDRLNASAGEIGDVDICTDGILIGNVVKGAVGNAQVNAFAIENGKKGSLISSTTTNTGGAFSLNIATYTGSLLLEAGGGTFLDEATGATMTMLENDIMRAVLPAVISCAPVYITPITTIAHARAVRMGDGCTDYNILLTNSTTGSFFGISNILHTRPIDPLLENSGTGPEVTNEMVNYGMILAALSQSASTLGMTSSSGMVTALAQDAADDTMDGMLSKVPISLAGIGGLTGGTLSPTAGTSDLADSLTAFINNSAVNKSGKTVTDMQGLINKLEGAKTFS